MFIKAVHHEDRYDIVSDREGNLIFTSKNGDTCQVPDEFKTTLCPLKGPLVVHLELTRECGLACKHCYISAGKTRVNELSTSEWKSMLCQLKDMEVMSVYLTGGDPLLHVGCAEIANYASSIGLSCNILTNGLEIAKGLDLNNFPREIFWVISFDGVKGTRKLRGISGEVVMRAACILKENERAFALQGLLFSGNIEEMPETIAWCQKEEIDFTLIDVLPIGRAKEHPELLLDISQIGDALEIEKIWQDYREKFSYSYPDYNVANPDIYKSIASISIETDRPEPGITVAYISSNGFLYPDNYYAAEDYQGAIDIRRTSIKKAWPEAFEKLRILKRSEFAGCKICTLYQQSNCDLQNTAISQFLYNTPSYCGVYPVLKQLKEMRRC